MKRNMIIVMILWISLLITACQGAGGSAPAATGGSSSENPSQSSAPTTGPTTASTSVPTSSVPLSLAELIAGTKITPVNDREPGSGNSIEIDSLAARTGMLDVPLGEIWWCDDIPVALGEYPGDTVVCVTISFNATLERYREMGYSEEELEALVDIIWQLFEDAGYQVYKNWMQYDKWICTYMTLDQIRTLDCGDNLALYLFFTGPHAW